MSRMDEHYLHLLLAQLLVRCLEYVKKYKLDTMVSDDEPAEEFFKVCSMVTKKRRKITLLKDDLIKVFEKEKLREPKRKALRGVLNALEGTLLEYLEKQEKYLDETSLIRDKLETFFMMLGLNKGEQKMVITALLVYIYDLEDLEGLEFYESYFSNIKTVAQICGMTRSAVQNCISDDHVLIRSELFFVKRHQCPLQLFQIKTTFLDVLMNRRIPKERIFERYFAQPEQKGLPMDCFYHLEEDVNILTSLLEGTRKKKGINVLLYGKPGTGKTIFAHSLLKSLNYTPITLETGGSKRLGIYRLCQKVYEEQRQVCIIFDEADSILSTTHISQGDNYRDKSGIINRMETNPTPCIWIVNSTDEIHSAVKRRFSYAIQFKKLPRDIMENILKKNLHRYKLPKDTMNADVMSFIHQENISLGQVSLAIERTRDIQRKKGDEPAQAILSGILKQMITLERGGRNVEIRHKNPMSHYQPSILSTDTEPELLIRAIQKFTHLQHQQLLLPVRNLNYLFHGPPGSGKSELARYIAQQLNKELMIKSASDLMDMYVGNTEKLIHEAFDEAEESEKILLLDEADSFFQKRTEAVRSWEVSQVNEILNAMERFRGILICTTNFITHFDPASLRRFAYKVKFNYLNPQQKLHLFKSLFPQLTPLKTPLQKRLKGIPRLTIGDFANVYKQSLFLPESSPQSVIKLLKLESTLKTDKATQIGFNA